MIRISSKGSLQGMPEVEQHVLIDNPRPHLFNYSDGRFIRQVLRATGSIDDRENTLKSEVERWRGY